MVARRSIRPRPKLRVRVADLNVNSIDDANRATSAIVDALAQATISERRAIVVDLEVGDNTINHGLGGRLVGAHVCPTVADATFASSFEARGDRQVVITVVGVAQPRAVVEVFR